MGGIAQIFNPPSPPVFAQQPAPAVDEAKLRSDILRSTRRGRSGMVLTSERGLVNVKDGVTQKKTLLGE